jgi:hypothetical protein
MTPSRPTASPRSLATIAPGETLEIRCILFDGVRDVCDRAGLREGDRVRCRDATPSRLLLESESGRAIHLDRRWADFVEAAESGAARPAARRVVRVTGPAGVSRVA